MSYNRGYGVYPLGKFKKPHFVNVFNKFRWSIKHHNSQSKLFVASPFRFTFPSQFLSCFIFKVVSGR